MSKRIVIVSGGEIDVETAVAIVKQPESRYTIAVDKGMEFLYAQKIYQDGRTCSSSIGKEGSWRDKQADRRELWFNPKTN